MTSDVDLAATTLTGTPLIGRCVVCKRAFRVTIPAGIQVFPAAPAGAIRAAGIAPVWCACRDGIRCAESPLGLPACGDSFCAGHPQGFVRFAAVKVTYKAEKACGGSCWSAKSSNCTCSCDGENHGGMWARW